MASYKKVKIAEDGTVTPEEEPMHLSRGNDGQVEWDSEADVVYDVSFTNSDSPFLDKGLQVPAQGKLHSGKIDPAAQNGKRYEYALVPVQAIGIGGTTRTDAADPTIIVQN